MSTKDIGLLVGQTAGYINNLENGVNHPSMTVFLYLRLFVSRSTEAF